MRTEELSWPGKACAEAYLQLAALWLCEGTALLLLPPTPNPSLVLVLSVFSVLQSSFPPFPGAGERNVFALSMAFETRRNYFNQKALIPLFTKDPTRTLPRFSQIFFLCELFPCTLQKLDQEFLAFCCLQLSSPCTHGHISYQPQFTSPGRGSPE